MRWLKKYNFTHKIIFLKSIVSLCVIYDQTVKVCLYKGRTGTPSISVGLVGSHIYVYNSASDDNPWMPDMIYWCLLGKPFVPQ